MWKARTKNDLIIEVWEKLDCESIGSTEIEAIELVVKEKYGEAAVESPMVIARLLADEGADLRHSEIMELYVERVSDRPYDAAFRGIVKIDSLDSAAASIRNLENLRRRYVADNDKEGIRLARHAGQRGKSSAAAIAEKETADESTRRINSEIASWFTVWLQTPDVFETWLDLRRRSPEFKGTFEAFSDPEH